MISQGIPVFDVTILIVRIQRRSAHILTQAAQECSGGRAAWVLR